MCMKCVAQQVGKPLKESESPSIPQRVILYGTFGVMALGWILEGIVRDFLEGGR